MPWPLLLRLNPPVGSSVTTWDSRYFDKAKTLGIPPSTKSRVLKRLMTYSKEGDGCFMEIVSVWTQDFDEDTSPIGFAWHRSMCCAGRDSSIVSGALLLPLRRCGLSTPNLDSKSYPYMTSYIIRSGHT